MKIFFRISNLGFGGAEQVFLSIARELQLKEDHQVIFVVDRRIGENVEIAEKLGFEVVSLQAKRTLTSILPMSKLITRLQPDVIISAYTDTNAACLLSNLITTHKVPIIVSEHASLKEHWQNKSFIKKRILKFYVACLYRLANKVLCVSNGLKGQVDALLKDSSKTIAIYNPVRFKGTKSIGKMKSKTLKLIAVGRVAPQKEYSTLIKAVSILRKSIPVSLKIIGGTANTCEYDKVTRITKELQLENEIDFVGYSDDVAQYYKDADIFVLSSAWEGFGNVIVEAMAFGLPVVSTNCNYGPAEILESGKYGRLVDVGDSEALANAIMHERSNTLAAPDSLIARSKEFSEEKIAQQYYSLIQEVISQ